VLSFEVPGVDFTRWETWVSIAVGLVTALLVFWLGYRLTRRLIFLHFFPLRRASGTQHRESRRRSGSIAVLISADGARTRTFPGRLLDRSRGGLALLVDEPFDRRTILHLRAAEAPQEVAWVKVEVRNCRRTGPVEWRVGCRYMQAIPPEATSWFG
jgi:hypothetical protein